LKHIVDLDSLKFLCVIVLSRMKSPMSKDETRRDSSLILHVYVFLCMVLLAVRMVANVTETRNVILSLGFKTCMTNINLKFLLF